MTVVSFLFSLPKICVFKTRSYWLMKKVKSVTRKKDLFALVMLRHQTIGFPCYEK